MTISCSVVIPYFDGGYRLPLFCKTMETLRAQGLGERNDLEVVIVEAGPVAALHEDHRPDCRYFRLERDGYNNPARAINAGIRQARGEIIMLQNPEVFHVGNVIRHACNNVKEDNIIFPRCFSLDESGKIDKRTPIYCGPENPRAFFFCGAILRKHLMAIGGVDEDYVLPSHDDDDLQDRLVKGLGLMPQFLADLHVYHQAHPRPGNLAWCHNEMRTLYDQKTRAWEAGEIDYVRNKDRDWGAL